MNPLADTLADEPLQDATSSTHTSAPQARRLFVAEPGWLVSMKTSSAREFCHNMAPGQDYYHRLLNGEIFVHRNEEHICVACAVRRGLLIHEPKRLAEIVIPVPENVEPIPLEPGWGELLPQADYPVSE